MSNCLQGALCDILRQNEGMGKGSTRYCHRLTLILGHHFDHIALLPVNNDGSYDQIILSYAIVTSESGDK